MTIASTHASKLRYAARIRAAQKAAGRVGATVFIGANEREAIDRAVQAGAFKSRREAIEYAVQAYFLNKTGESAAVT